MWPLWPPQRLPDVTSVGVEPNVGEQPAVRLPQLGPEQLLQLERLPAKDDVVRPELRARAKVVGPVPDVDYPEGPESVLPPRAQVFHENVALAKVARAERAEILGVVRGDLYPLFFEVHAGVVGIDGGKNRLQFLRPESRKREIRGRMIASVRKRVYYRSVNCSPKSFSHKSLKLKSAYILATYSVLFGHVFACFGHIFCAFRPNILCFSDTYSVLFGHIFFCLLPVT